MSSASSTIMQGANRANVSFYPVDPGRLFSGRIRSMSNRRRSLEMMADITDGQAIMQTALYRIGPSPHRRRSQQLLSARLLLARES